MKCHFVLYKLDDTRDSRTQKRDSIDSRKNKKVVADRMIQLLAYKDHFMIDMDEYLPITKYCIEHKDELDKKFSDVPIAKRQIIKIISERNPMDMDSPLLLKLCINVVTFEK